MLSRVAESIFWMNRYIERAENVARFIDVNMNLTLDLGDNIVEQWMPLVNTTGDHELFLERYGVPTQQNVIEFLAFDLQNPNSIRSCLAAARENARTVREIIPSVMWEEVNKFFLMVNNIARSDRSTGMPFDFFERVKLGSYLFVGLNETTMSHDEVWHFARLGRLLERADKTSRILDVKYFILLPTPQEVGMPVDTIQWSSLLKSTDAFHMYRKCFGRINPADVVGFLILNHEFPRAMRYCLIQAEESLHAISGSQLGSFQNIAERRLGRLRSELDYIQFDDIIAQGLHEFIDHFQLKLNEAAEAIHESFFAMRPVANQSQRQRQQ